MEEDGHGGSARSYKTTIESLKRFIKRDTLAISEITSVFMEDYEKWLKDRKPLSNRVLGDRALSLYPGYIRALHNLAKKEYNDEEMGIIRIPWSPFQKYHVKKPTPAKKKKSFGRNDKEDTYSSRSTFYEYWMYTCKLSARCICFYLFILSE